MGKMITIDLPEEIYGPLKTFSKEKNIPEINKVIFHILKTFINEKRNRVKDPLFLPITNKGSNTTDVSEKHDKYLYGN